MAFGDRDYQTKLKGLRDVHCCNHSAVRCVISDSPPKIRCSGSSASGPAASLGLSELIISDTSTCEKVTSSGSKDVSCKSFEYNIAP